MKRSIPALLVAGLTLLPSVANAAPNMYPLRSTFENLGATVTWNQQKFAAIVVMDGVTWELPLGKAEIIVGGDKFATNAPTTSINGRSFISAEVLETIRNSKRLTEVMLPKGTEYKTLLSTGDTLADGNTFAANPDLNVYVPINGSDEGYLATNHENRPGGMTISHVKRNADGFYEIISTKAVDFSQVGGTWNNCAGQLTPWGTVLSGEEYPPVQQEELTKIGLSGKPEDFGWIVEVNPVTGAVQKHYAMGRFSHEGATVMPDQKTVYMGDDFRGGAVFKFVADKAGDLSEGQLYAYKMETNSWLAVPRDREVLNDARKWAAENGATLFDRPEEIEYNPVDGMVYMAETGDDKKTGVNQTGRVWKLNPQTSTMEIFVQGGPETNLYQPDNITVDPKGNLLVQEDKYFKFMAPATGQSLNGIWKIAPDRTMERFMEVPLGSEVTGGFFNPDGSIFFVTIQHPASPNKASVLQIKMK